MKVDDLNESLIDFLQKSFKGKTIEVSVHEEPEMDETDFILKDPIAREKILKAIENINQNKNLKELNSEELNNVVFRHPEN